MNKYITTIQQYADTEDYFIQIPQEIINQLNWQEGDQIDWQINNQEIIITKIKDSTKSRKEPTLSDYDWYTVKEKNLQEYYNSESEGKEYIKATNEETYGAEGIKLT